MNKRLIIVIKARYIDELLVELNDLENDIRKRLSHGKMKGKFSNSSSNCEYRIEDDIDIIPKTSTCNNCGNIYLVFAQDNYCSNCGKRLKNNK